MENTEFQLRFDRLSDQRKSFIRNYVATLSKTKAALLSGYSAHSASQIGWTLYHDDEINPLILHLIKAGETPIEEVVDMVSAISKSNVMDYYVPTEVEYTPRKKVSLQVVINNLEAELNSEYDFFMTRFFDKTEMSEYNYRVNQISDKISRTIIDLRNNPNATRIISCEPEFKEVLVLDMKLLQADKKRGRVKSVSHKKDGSFSLELYSAAEAHEKLMRMNGKYAKDNEQQAVRVINVIVPDSENE